MATARQGAPTRKAGTVLAQWLRKDFCGSGGGLQGEMPRVVTLPLPHPHYSHGDGLTASIPVSTSARSSLKYGEL